jgi:hypothetical protein
MANRETKSRAREQLGRALGFMAPRIERVTVRFEDVNGPRGGKDTLCRIKAVVSGEPSVVVEEKGHNPDHALALATPRIRRSLRQLFERRRVRKPPASRGVIRARSRAKPSRKSPRSATRAKGRSSKSRGATRSPT